MVGRRQVAERVDLAFEQLSRVRPQACHLRFGGRVVGQELDGRATRAERHRACDVGHLVDALRELERAAADVEEQDVFGRPAVPAPHGEEGQVRLVFAGEHLEFDVGLAGDAVEHLFAVGGLADGRRREGEEFVEAGFAGDRGRVADGGDDRRDALVADRRRRARGSA